MESVIVVLLALLIALSVVLLLRQRSASLQSTPPSPALQERPPASELATASSLDAAAVIDGGGELIETYRLRDPQSQSRELLVEFVPPSLAQLTDQARDASAEHGHAARNAFDGIINSIPKAAVMIEAGMTMRVVGPPDALAGLANHSLELVTSGGRALGIARDVGSGQFAAHLRFAAAGVTPATAALGVFQAMSVVTGQYYLQRIDTKLADIEAGVERIIAGQQAEAFGKLQTAAKRNRQVRETLTKGIAPSADERQALDRADDLASSVYSEAQKNLSGFLHKLKRFELPSADKGDVRAMWAEASGPALEDANLLLFAAFVRHENNLLELAIDPQGDPVRAAHIKERVDAEREQMLTDLHALKPLYTRLAYPRSRLDDRFRFGVDKLAAESKEFATKWKAIRGFVDDPEHAALPPAPEIDLPFLAEVCKDDSGDLLIASAILRERA